MMEHIGDMSAISSTVGNATSSQIRVCTARCWATVWPPSLASLFGAPANTTYGENTGVLALTRVYRPARSSAWPPCFAIVFSFCPKFAALDSLPCPPATIGGVSLMLYGMISAVGVRNVVENQRGLHARAATSSSRR